MVSNREVIAESYRRGWFFGDVFERYGIQQSDLDTLTVSDLAVRDAFIAGSRMQSPEYTSAVRGIHDREPNFDGEPGPAFHRMLNVERCGLPDFDIPKDAKFAFDDPDVQAAWECLQNLAGLPALGTGSWKSCHGVGNYHSAIVDLDLSGMPSNMAKDMNGKTVLHACLSAVQKAKALFGLLWKFRYQGKDYLTGETLDGSSNTGLSFVRSSNGWIGLAIVGRGETCSSQPIWLRLLSTYLATTSNLDRYLSQWWALTAHELGHNESSGHLSGDPIMHPSINPNVTETVIDPNSSYGRFLAQQFGGEAVPYDNPAPDPTPPTPPGGDPYDGAVINIEKDQKLYGPYRLVWEPRTG